MSDMMRPIPFSKIMDRMLEEKPKGNKVYEVTNLYTHESDKTLHLFGHDLETPVGPAAGPHTQLAQNLVAAYVGGARFFELKTVQTLDGEDLPIDKPCIRADDECYNVEWSTELYVPQALAEYIKGWYACKLIAKEFGFGDPNGFIFNMSVGYNYEGITSKKIDDFIEGLKDASTTAIWKECEAYALANLSKFKHVDEAFIRSIDSCVCNSITLSTMHGCPADEIEKITSYLLSEKKIYTYLKCNPTLLGYEFVRKTMDDMGYDYMVFDEHHFQHDLQYSDAIQMIKRLITLAQEQGLAFGVKLSNTFPVKIARKELPGEEMYMSGKSLYPLTINLASKLAKEFDGNLPMSYSGGADNFNIKDIFETGIWPITVATVLLKPTGYNKMKQLTDLVVSAPYPSDQKVHAQPLEALAKKALEDVKYRKNDAVKVKPLVSFDAHKKVGIDCRVVCGTCVNVCPNRANTITMVNDKKVMMHIDDYCNECGNCYIFCPDPCTPYKDRFTIFNNVEDFKNSTNQGVIVVASETIMYRLDDEVVECSLTSAPQIIIDLVKGIQDTHSYLL